MRLGSSENTKYILDIIQNDTFYSDPESGWKNAISQMVHAI